MNAEESEKSDALRAAFRSRLVQHSSAAGDASHSADLELAVLQPKSPAERLAVFRCLAAAEGCDAALVFTADPHLSEYVPAHWALRRALTGFTGSAGALAVTAKAAAMATDSRYWEQAAGELPSSIELIKSKGNLADELVSWLGKRLPDGASVAVDPESISLSQARALEQALTAQHLKLKYLELDLSRCWPDRPPVPHSAVSAMRRPGSSVREKLRRIRRDMVDAGASAVLLSALDDVAWATNLRGSDVPCNPVFLSYLIVREKEAVLYIDADRLDAAAKRVCRTAGIRLEAPAALARDVSRFSSEGFFMADPSTTNYALASLISEPHFLESASPAAAMKSVKTASEIEAIDEAMLRDAVALAEFYAELDERLARGELLTECDAADMLHAWRAKQPGFIGESFETIAAYGPNAALPHYQPHRESAAKLEAGGLLLIDSGGQYDCGTTDITRMTPVGEPSDAMKADVAMTTRAMLRLLNLRFPEGATGRTVDLAGRMDLWKAGIDFGHGTGHGVGYCLNVHEGPLTISPRAQEVPFKPGNVISDEPGIYRPGRWGVRVENLMTVEEAGETEFGRFLRFRPLTLLPIDVRALPEPFGELADELNQFNERCVKALTGRLSSRAEAWLQASAAPVRRG